MRTLIRASQLHPDVSGLVKTYADPLYPNYNDLSGVSGIKSVVVGDNLYFTLDSNNGNFVQSFAGLTGDIRITGTSGIYSYISGGSTIVFGLTGSSSVTRLNTLSGNITLSGAGTVDVWPRNSNTIAISGISITGQQNISSYISGGVIRLTAQTVSQINSTSGAVTLIGSGGTNIVKVGQNLYIDSSTAANSGVKSINGIAGSQVTISGLGDINIDTNTFLRNINIRYVGSGWGINSLSSPSGTYNWIGYDNIFNNTNIRTFINGNENLLSDNINVSTLNSNDNDFFNCKNSSFINTSGAYLSGASGITIINGLNCTGDGFAHPYGFGIGNNLNNGFFTNLTLKARVTGGQILKPMNIPRTNYSGIKVPTGSALIGHVDYFGVKYAPVTDFLASFAAPDYEEAIYGRKYFVVLRGTNLQTVIKDQADLFGGSDDYGIFIESGNNADFYIIASGKPTESTMFHASVQYSQFTLDGGYD